MVVWGPEVTTSKIGNSMSISMHDGDTDHMDDVTFFGRTFRRVLGFLSFFDFRDRHSRFRKDMSRNGQRHGKKKN